MAKDPEKTRDEQLAELLERLSGVLDGEDGLETMKERFKVLQDEIEELKKADWKNVAEEIEKLRSTQEHVVKVIRTHRGGLYVPGLEDEAEEFSLTRCFIAAKYGNWEKVAPREWEVVKQVREKAAQSVGDDSLGGFFVPDQVIPDVIGAIYTASVMINLSGEDGDSTRVSVISGLSGANVKIPKFNGGMLAYWIGEEDDYTESQVTVGDVTLNPKKLGLLVKLTDTIRRLGALGFERLLRRDMVRAAAKKLDWTIMFGKGSSDMPRGIVNTPGIKIYSTQSKLVYTTFAAAEAGNSGDWTGGDELDWDGLDSMHLALEEDNIERDGTDAFISSPRYWKRLKQLKVDSYEDQAVNRAYLIGVPMIPDARLRDIIGDFGRSTQIPSGVKPGASLELPSASGTAKFTTVFGGNLGEVLLARWGGIEIEDDAGRGTGFISDHTLLKLRLYADVGVRQERALVVCPDARSHPST
jgi:HK97 family phage major capsid protein